MKKLIYLALLCACLLCLCACGKTEFVPYEDSAEALFYEPQSPFELLDAESLDGAGVSAETLAAHELNMINIWATWCGYCIQEMPGIEALSQSHDDIGFYGLLVESDPRTGAVLVGVSESERAAAEAILAETGASYPQMLVSEAMLPFFTELYSFPTTYFVDAEGKLVGEPVLGAKSEEAWEEILAERWELAHE